jgi:hypothetical protein
MLSDVQRNILENSYLHPVETYRRRKESKIHIETGMNRRRANAIVNNTVIN